MATYDFSVGDYGGSRTWTVTHRGSTVGNLTGMTVNACKVTNPSGVVEDWTAGFTGGASSTVAFAPPSSSYFDEVGTWTFDIRYTLGSTTETLDTITLTVGPSGGTSVGSVAGATTATGLNAQITQLATSATASNPLWIVLPEGTLTLDDTIDLASHVYIRAEYPGATRITRSDAPVVGLADDPTNAVFYAAATVSATTTTLTDEAASGDTALTVADTTGFAANDWVLVSGVPGDATDGGDAGGESGPGLTLYGLYKVASVAGGVTINLVQPVEGYHSTTTATATACTVTKVTPVEDVRIEGIYFDCASGSVAAGVSARSAVDVTIKDCRFRGFSRAGVTADRATTGLRVLDCRKEGETCADVMTESCRHIEVAGLTCNPTGTRCHSNGIPRHSVVSRLRDIGYNVHDCDIQNAQGGLEFWGAWHVTIANIHVRDCDPTERQARAAATELDAGLGFGVGLDFGTTSVTNGYTSYCWDVAITNVTIEDVSCPDSAISAYLHDTYHMAVANLSVLCHGRSPTSVGARDMGGVIVSDILGSFQLENLTVRGVSGYALEFQNAGAVHGGFLKNIEIHNVAGTTANPGTAGVYFNTDANGTGYTVIDGLKIDNFATSWAFGSAFTNYALRVRNLVYDGVWRPIDDCIIVRNNAGASFNAYSLGELSNGAAGGQQVFVVASSGAAVAKNVVMYSPTSASSNATFWLAGVTGKGKSNTIRTARDSAINAGDLLVAGASGNAVVDNAANGEDVVGVALTNYALSGGATAQVPTV